MDNIRSIYFINSSGQRANLYHAESPQFFEMGYRRGFSAPEIEIHWQKYANGVTKVLKRQLKPRYVSMKMMAMGESRAERDAVFFDMVSKLMDVSGGEDGKLYVMRSDGTEVYINCVYSSGLSVEEQYRRYQSFILEFYAADPYFYKDAPNTVIEIPASQKLTLGDTLALGEHVLGETSGTASGIVSNHGSEPLKPVIKAVGISGSITIKNLTTGVEIALSGVTIPTGSTLVIDTRDDTKDIYILAEDGTTYPAGQYLDWENLDFSFDIVPGDNIVSFEVSIGSMTDQIIFEMSERYLSA